MDVPPPTFCYYEDEPLTLEHRHLVFHYAIEAGGGAGDLTSYIMLKFIDSLLCELLGCVPEIEASCTVTDEGKFCYVRYNDIERSGFVGDKIARFIEQDTPETDPTTHTEFKLHARTNGTVNLGWENGYLWGLAISYKDCRPLDDIGTFEKPIQYQNHIWAAYPMEVIER